VPLSEPFKGGAGADGGDAFTLELDGVSVHRRGNPMADHIQVGGAVPIKSDRLAAPTFAGRGWTVLLDPRGDLGGVDTSTVRFAAFAGRYPFLRGACRPPFPFSGVQGVAAFAVLYATVRGRHQVPFRCMPGGCRSR
jgi:hypothetical protein